MTHWNFLEDRLGKDVVYYCIQPFLLPAKKTTIKKMKPTLQIFENLIQTAEMMFEENIFETKKFSDEHFEVTKFEDEYYAGNYFRPKIIKMGLLGVELDDLFKYWIKQRYVPVTYEWIGQLIIEGKVKLGFRLFLDPSCRAQSCDERKRRGKILHKLFGNKPITYIESRLNR